MIQSIHCRSCGRISSHTPGNECPICGSRLLEPVRAIPKMATPLPRQSHIADEFRKPFVSSLIFMMAGFLAIFFDGALNIRSLGMIAIGVIFLIAGIVLGIVATIAACKIIYRAWSVLENAPELRSDTDKVTPSNAVLLLFVPIIQLFWIFRVFPGWASRAQKCLNERGMDSSVVKSDLHMAFAVCNLIPFVNCFSAILFPFTVINMAEVTESLEPKTNRILNPRRVNVA